MHVLIAPESIAPMLSAVDTAAALAAPWREAGHQVREMPLGTGATGLIDAVSAAKGGTTHPVAVRGPHAVAEMLLVERTAFLEAGPVLAGAPQPDAHGLLGSTAPVAELLLAAQQAGATRMVLGLGATAMHDGGAGVLSRLAEAFGCSAEPSADTLTALRNGVAGLQIDVAAGTDLPLLGLHGAGAALARYPGLDATIAQRAENRVGEQVSAWERADAGTVRHSLLTGDRAPRPGRAPHSGAGGGAGFALALLGARLLPGTELVAAEVGLAEAVAEADLVITAAPALDGDAMHDGVPAVVGQSAMEVGLPVVAIGWEVHTSRRDGARVGISATYPVIEARMPGSQAPPSPDPLTALRARGVRIVKTWAQ
ncbi:glycerate kinase [Ruania zhangjianzhongii]|uniref:glycerate kinase n=1 Tax=Ruania zhangjianzhongii TaxID=2603206 RepID=UPI00143D5D13|nr:glycerate kinase [Ruania zhangjianzhongii]